MFKISNFKELHILGALFVTLFLLTLSLSSLLMYVKLNIALNSVVVIILVLLLSLVLSSRVKHGHLLILLSLMAMLLHQLLFYLLIPVGWAGDQRIFFIHIIEDAGRIDVLERFAYVEGAYYTSYPVPWLDALFIKLILGISSGDSWLLIITTVYLSFLVFLILTYNTLINIFSNKHNDNMLKSLAWLILITELTIYIHRPFLDLIADSFGLLSTIMVLYLYFSNFYTDNKKVYVLLLVLIPLLVAHALAIYYSALLLILVVIIAKHKKIAVKAIYFVIIILIGTWIYQVNSQLIMNIPMEISYRYKQILETLKSGLLERPSSGLSIKEQELRFVYVFSPIVTFTAYLFPIILVGISALFFMYTLIRRKDKRNVPYTTLFPYSTLALFMFLVAGYFAWKGIENAIARYLYEYAAVTSVIINSIMLNLIWNDIKFKLIKILCIATLLTIGILSLTESFFTPYASIIRIPDPTQFSILYSRYYGPSSCNQNLISTLFPGVSTEVQLSGSAELIPLYSNTEGQHYSIVYSSNRLCSIILRS